VELRSDFADVTFRSKTSYRTVFEYLRRSAWKYLPMLGGEKWEETPSERKAAVANDFSLLSVNIRNFNPVADAVSTGLQIADGSSLQLLFNPASDQLSLKAASEYIERRRMLATRLSVNASNRGDSLAVYASAEDLYAGVLHLPRLSLTGGARQNRVQLSAGFDDTLRRMNVSPLGSCALAGTTYHINRDRTAELLGMSAPMVNSLDGVSDRDFCIELASAISICMMHLSRFSEEIIMWCSWEFKFIELSDRFSTGSSIMPQKKNPDVTELIRGKTARVIGDNMTILAMMKGLPLAYNKDMQEDKEAIFDAVDNLKLCLTTFIPMLETMTLYKDNMRRAAAKGFINATDCADYLVKKGMPFRTAYKITGGLVAHCIELGTTLEELPLADYQKQSELFTEDVYDAISLDTCVKERKSFGGPAPESVKTQIALTRKRLEELCNG